MKQDKLMRFYRSARDIEAQTSCLTVRDCMNAWGYATTSAAQYTMNLMVDAGLLRKIQRGSHFIYRTIQGMEE